MITVVYVFDITTFPFSYLLLGKTMRAVIIARAVILIFFILCLLQQIINKLILFLWFPYKVLRENVLLQRVIYYSDISIINIITL
jgi:hypothetical protein